MTNDAESNLEWCGASRERSVRSGRRQSILSTRCNPSRIFQREQHPHGLSVEGHCQLLHDRSGWQNQSGCCLVLPHAQRCCQKYHWLHCVLERRESGSLKCSSGMPANPVQSYRCNEWKCNVPKTSILQRLQRRTTIHNCNGMPCLTDTERANDNAFANVSLGAIAGQTNRVKPFLPP